MGKPTTLELLLAMIAGKEVNDVIVLQTKVDHLLAEIAERANAQFLPRAVDSENGCIPVVQANGEYALEWLPFRVTFSGDEESAQIDWPAETVVRALAQRRPIAWQYERTDTDINVRNNSIYTLAPVRVTRQYRTVGEKHYLNYSVEGIAFLTYNPNDASDSYEYVSARLDLTQNEDGSYARQVSVVFKIV